VLTCFWIQLFPERARILFTDRGNPSGGTFTLEDVLEYVLDAERSPSRYGKDRLGRGLCFTLTLCPCPPGDDETRYYRGFEQYVALERRLRMADNAGETSQALSSDGEVAMAFWQAMSAMCTGRAFAVTESGYYGLVPGITRPGDQVCVLMGLDVPFVLRPTSERRFRLLGEAHVQWLMNGEALEMVRSEGLAEETFSIW
jgi:hypothetical protein